VIDENGIGMDPEKVDRIANWKEPTNKALLMQFNGAVGYLAADCPGLRIPMAVLTRRTGSTVPWRWTATEAETINLVTDASYTGASGVVTQGNDLKYEQELLAIVESLKRFKNLL